MRAVGLKQYGCNNPWTSLLTTLRRLRCPNIRTYRRTTYMYSILFVRTKPSITPTSSSHHMIHIPPSMHSANLITRSVVRLPSHKHHRSQRRDETTHQPQKDPSPILTTVTHICTSFSQPIAKAAKKNVLLPFIPIKHQPRGTNHPGSKTTGPRQRTSLASKQAFTSSETRQAVTVVSLEYLAFACCTPVFFHVSHSPTPARDLLIRAFYVGE